jgi:hypothetical protein
MHIASTSEKPTPAPTCNIIKECKKKRGHKKDKHYPIETIHRTFGEHKHYQAIDGASVSSMRKWLHLFAAAK